MDNLENRIHHVTSSMLFCEQGVNELINLIGEFKLAETQKLVNLPPFNFYKASLCYLIIMEYCKLFEPRKKPVQLSSIIRLCNNQTLSELNDDIVELNNIPESKIYNTVLLLRDKKIGHSDTHELNKPFNIPLLKRNELEEIKDNLLQAMKLLNLIRIKEGLPEVISIFTINNPQTIQNLVTLSITKEYYFKFFNEAISRGYDAIRGELP